MYTENQRFKQFCDYLKSQGSAKNKKEIADMFGLTAPMVGYMFNGTRQVSSKTRRMLEQDFGVNPLWLSGHEDVPMFLEDDLLSSSTTDDVHIIDQHSENVSKYPVSIAAGDNNSVSAPESIKLYKVPGVRGSSVAFLISGQSMEPTLSDNQTVFARYVEDFDDIRDGGVYIVIAREKQVAKRVYHAGDHLLMVSDNPAPEYAPYQLPLEDVQQIFKVEQKLSSEGL